MVVCHARLGSGAARAGRTDPRRGRPRGRRAGAGGGRPAARGRRRPGGGRPAGRRYGLAPRLPGGRRAPIRGHVDRHGALPGPPARRRGGGGERGKRRARRGLGPRRRAGRAGADPREPRHRRALGRRAGGGAATISSRRSAWRSSRATTSCCSWPRATRRRWRPTPGTSARPRRGPSWRSSSRNVTAGRRWPMSRWPTPRSASVHLWRGELDVAAASVERAHAAVADSREPLLRPGVGVMRSAVLALRGEPARALDALRGASAHGPMPRLLSVSTGLLEAQLWLALGEPDRAHRILEGLEHCSPDARQRTRAAPARRGRSGRRRAHDRGLPRGRARGPDPVRPRRGARARGDRPRRDARRGRRAARRSSARSTWPSRAAAPSAGGSLRRPGALPAAAPRSAAGRATARWRTS